jgi:acyl-homoserine-lactone acylase
MRLSAAGVITAALLSATSSQAAHRAEISRTSYGIPHVTAGDWQSLGFGEAYAYAEDNLCMLADKIVTVRGERAQTFGSDGSVSVAFSDVPNVESDIFFRSEIDLPALRQGFSKASPQYQDLVRGYVAGYNQFLVDTPSAARPQACRGAPWVSKITLDDMLRLNEERAIQASGGAWLRQTTSAAPPGPKTKLAALNLPAEPALAGLGSNGWAFGRDVTANGSGVLLGNPHFPWEGPNRFYEVHLTLPGQLDVMGVAIGGSPGMSIGFNKDVAWTHTVSTDRHFTLFELTLDPTDPTVYLVDGQKTPMMRTVVTAPVKGAGPVVRTLYSTIWGPVVAAPQAGLSWTAKTPYALKDANLDDTRGGDAWLGIARAKSVRDIQSIIVATLGMPWVNTIAADREGEALYADVTSTPNVSAEKMKACAAPSGVSPLAAARRVFILDGARSACGWDVTPGAAVPGLMAGEDMPSIIRTDYVANSNDSYWLANASAPMAGKPPIIGPIDTIQNLRTRAGVLAIEAALAGHGPSPGAKISPLTVEAILYRNEDLAAELVLPDLGRVCGDGAPIKTAGGRTVDITHACAVLAAWDRRMDLHSVGPQLFIEFWKRAQTASVWATPFDPKDPIHSPRGLSADPQTVVKLRAALADAVADLADAKISIDAPWGEVQVATRGGLRIPVHGGEGGDGVLNAQESRKIAGVGFVPYHGSSYIQAATFDVEGPVVDAILTYGQSTDPSSPHFADQTQLFSHKQWVRLPFSKSQIAADRSITRKIVHD